MSDPAYDEPWRDVHEPWRASLEPWRASLERSRTRRGKAMPSQIELARWTAARMPVEPSPRRTARAPVEPSHQPTARAPVEPSHQPTAGAPAEPSPRRTAAWTVRRRQRILLLASPVGLVALIVIAAALPTASDGFALKVLAMSGHGLRNAIRPRPRAVARATASPGHARTVAPVSCERTSASGYVNPLADAIVTPKRIDQGVDYTAGSGVLRAIGPGTITVVATTDTGWPGAFIEYQLTAGPAAGCSVFYAEGVEPLTGLAVGEAVHTGSPVASIVPGWSSGIEIGWGAGSGTATYAAKMGEWSATADTDSIPTAAGESFSLLIASLGGPPGRLEHAQ